MFTYESAPGRTASQSRDDSLGLFIQGLRLSRRLSQRAVASRANIANSTLSRWERGLSTPNVAELDSVLNVVRASQAQRVHAFRLISEPRAIRRLKHDGQHWASISGDLLRAMRMRGGRSQADVASKLAISQAMLAKWEASEDWPSLEKLHALCFELGAHPEELEALTLGRFSPRTLTENSADRAQLHADIEKTPELLDLRFLAFLAKFDEASLQSTSVKKEFVDGCIDYAYNLNERGRTWESKTYAELALKHLPVKHGTAPSQACHIYICQGLVTRGRKSRTAAITRLNDLISDGVVYDNFARWIKLDLAVALVQAGRTEQAWHWAAQALGKGSSGFDDSHQEDVLYMSKLHLLAGQAREAVALISSHSFRFALKDYWLIRAALICGKSFALLGDYDQAEVNLAAAFERAEQVGAFAYARDARDWTAKTAAMRN